MVLLDLLHLLLAQPAGCCRSDVSKVEYAIQLALIPTQVLNALQDKHREALLSNSATPQKPPQLLAICHVRDLTCLITVGISISLRQLG